jgi:DNA-directed RNA polymerase subunit RPC12/RpoP
MNKRNSQFRRGSGVYKCADCGKQTRETGSSESFNNLCRKCYDKAGDDNAVADGVLTEDQFFAIYGEHSSWYKA